MKRERKNKQELLKPEEAPASQLLAWLHDVVARVSGKDPNKVKIKHSPGLSEAELNRQAEEALSHQFEADSYEDD